MRTILKIGLVFITIIFSECRNNPLEHSQKLKVISITTDNSIKELQLSNIASDIEYVKLEFRPECAIRYIFDTYITNKFIFIKSDAKIFQFTRTGKFVRQIGRNGKGPGEYTVPRGFTVDEKQNLIYIYSNSSKTLLKFNFEGNFLGSIKISDFANQLDIIDPEKLVIHRDFGVPLFSKDFFIAGVIKTNGDTIYINKNSISKDYQLSKIDMSNSKGGNILWYNGDTCMIYDINYNDTLYKVSSHNLIPQYILNYNSKKCPFNIYFDPKQYRKFYMNYIEIRDILETKDALFVNFKYNNNAYITMYNKQSGEQFLDKQEYNGPPISSYQESFNVYYAFKNDFDGGLDVWPSQQKGNICCNVIEIEDLTTRLTPEYFIKSKAKYPDKKKALQKLVQNITEIDNPVLMIIKLK